MDSARRLELRTTFEDDLGDLYHRARPRYPEALFNDLVELTGLAPSSRLLEIGAGTGIATVPLAERGFRVIGVEPGASMARTARASLVGLESVEIIEGSIETYVPDAAFDAVVVFSAFHWLDPSSRYAIAASYLRNSGILVVADARLTVPEDADPFFVEVADDYRSVLGERINAPGAPALASLGSEMSGSGFFSHVATRRYRWNDARTADTYIDLLDTFPWHRTLEASERSELYARIRRRIAERASGSVTVTFEAVIDVGQTP